MFQFKPTVFVVIMAIILGLAIFCYNIVHSTRTEPSMSSTSTTRSVSQDSRRFNNPEMALEILRILDTPTSTIDEEKHFNVFSRSRNQSKNPTQTIMPDYDYCDKRLEYIIKNSDIIFIKKNFFLDYHLNNLVCKKVVPKLGKDEYPKFTNLLTKKINAQNKIPFLVGVSIFFTNTMIYPYQQIDKQFSCLSQISNHIPGYYKINRKSFLAESVVEYAKKYKTRPQCFNFDKFFSQTWLLYHKNQCLEFFKEFNSNEYQTEKKEKRIIYITKLGFGEHKAKRIQIVNEEKQQYLRDTYQNGTMCGLIKKHYIIQTFIAYPLLVDGHKFDIRVYMLIASTNPTILYYHDGFLRIALHDYYVNSADKSPLLTGTELAKEFFLEAANGKLFTGLNATELRNFQTWDFQKLHSYLMQRNLVSDPNWLDNYLRPEFKKAMIHLVRISEGAFLKRSSVYELFEVDFMLDRKLNLWFIKCSSGPVFKGGLGEKEKFLIKMLRDQFEIVFDLLKSRMKRVILYVNKLVNEEVATSRRQGEIFIYDLEERRKEFAKLKTNYFDEEFEPSPMNGFFKIIDGNLEGEERFAGLIEKVCIDLNILCKLRHSLIK